VEANDLKIKGVRPLSQKTQATLRSFLRLVFAKVAALARTS
jgi:hypothetical protein